MTTVSTFRNNQLTGNRPLLTILNHIKKGTEKEIVENYRQLLLDGKDDWADQLLLHLTAFTPAGRFDKIRHRNDILFYSRIVMLETNPLTEKELAKVHQVAIADQHTYASFRSIAGNTLIILVPVESEAHQHPRTFNRVLNYYTSRRGLPLSANGFRLTDLCYYSSDPDAFINPDATPLPLQPGPAGGPPASNAVALPTTRFILHAVRFPCLN